jgi:hypothetical protein
MVKKTIQEKYVQEYREIGGKKIPMVSAVLSVRDKVGAVGVRLGFGRNHYRVSPGLYGIGNPDKNSPVLVTANYTLTFESLRKELKGVNAWILVLDTKGINVWCAAGKGTFGTKELVSRILSTELFNVVGHKTVIVPQLGAVGVAAHQVTSFTKFRVIYGPVRASDIREFLEKGMKKTEAMREVRFGFFDRAVLVPVEIRNYWPVYPGIYLLFLILDLVSYRQFSFSWLLRSLVQSLPFIGGVLTGCVLVPLLLPWIPFRAFSWKGWLLGAVLFIPFAVLAHLSFWNALAGTMIFVSLSAFFAMNFTGSSTFTNLQGAEQEVRTGTPVMIVMTAAGIVLKTLTALKIIL